MRLTIVQGMIGDGFDKVRAALIAAADELSHPAWTEAFLEASTPALVEKPRSARVIAAVDVEPGRVTELAVAVLNANRGAQAQLEWVKRLVQALGNAGVDVVAQSEEPSPVDGRIRQFRRPATTRWKVSADLGHRETGIDTDSDSLLPEPDGDDQLTLLKVVYALALSASDWPTHQSVDERMYRQHGVRKMNPVWEALPSGLLTPSFPTGGVIAGTQLRLTAAGVYQVLQHQTDGHREVEAAAFEATFLDLVRIAVLIEFQGRGDLNHRYAISRNGSTSLALVVLVGLVLATEPLGFVNVTRHLDDELEDMGWSMTPTSAIRDYDGVRSMSQYWTIRQRENPTLDRPRGTIVTVTTADQEPAPKDPRRIFLVHGRNDRAKTAMTQFLRALDLLVVGWDEAREQAQKTGRTGSPDTLSIVEAGMDLAAGVLVLFTPDDEARLNPHFQHPTDPEDDRQVTGQARQNVILEAGMAWSRDKSKVVLARLGRVRGISDISGINFVNIRNDLSARTDLAKALRGLGLAVDLEHPDRWSTDGDFDEALNIPAPPPFDRASAAKPRPRHPAAQEPRTDREALQQEIDFICKSADAQGWEWKRRDTSLTLVNRKGARFQTRLGEPLQTRHDLRAYAARLNANGLRVRYSVREPLPVWEPPF